MLSYFHSMVTTTQLQDDALDLTVRINKKFKQQDFVSHINSLLIWTLLKKRFSYYLLNLLRRPTNRAPGPFKNVLKDKDDTEVLTHFYMGEDEEEKFESVDSIFLSTTDDEPTEETSPLPIEIFKDKYLSLFNPWRGALILKLLGKTVSFEVLQQSTSTLWSLQWGYELINLEGGFYLARFFTRLTTYQFWKVALGL